MGPAGSEKMLRAPYAIGRTSGRGLRRRTGVSPSPRSPNPPPSGLGRALRRLRCVRRRLRRGRRRGSGSRRGARLRRRWRGIRRRLGWRGRRRRGGLRLRGGGRWRRRPDRRAHRTPVMTPVVRIATIAVMNVGPIAGRLDGVGLGRCRRHIGISHCRRQQKRRSDAQAHERFPHCLLHLALWSQRAIPQKVRGLRGSPRAWRNCYFGCA